jgi:hypothetical protein
MKVLLLFCFIVLLTILSINADTDTDKKTNLDNNELKKFLREKSAAYFQKQQKRKLNLFDDENGLVGQYMKKNVDNKEGIVLLNEYMKTRKNKLRVGQKGIFRNIRNKLVNAGNAVSGGFKGAAGATVKFSKQTLAAVKTGTISVADWVEDASYDTARFIKTDFTEVFTDDIGGAFNDAFEKIENTAKKLVIVLII